MSIAFIEGPAGSGKTTRLIALLEEEAPDRLEPSQRLLMLSRMHGARARMAERLTKVPSLARRFEARTIDSFAWEVFARWRDLARRLAWEPGGVGPEAYRVTAEAAAALLAFEPVRRWVARGYPIIGVDELQDCNGPYLAIIQQLAEAGRVVAAGDAFQDLSELPTNDATEWGRTSSERYPLTSIHRTESGDLRRAAEAFRMGTELPKNGGDFFVLRAFNANVAASLIARTIKWNWSVGDIVVISPRRPGTNSFVDDAINRVATQECGFTANRKKQKAGPYRRLKWESSFDDRLEAVSRDLALPEDRGAVVRKDVLGRLQSEPGVRNQLQTWMEWRQRIGLGDSIEVGDLLERAHRELQQVHARRVGREAKLRVTTIHQAKNREFSTAIVLWPFAVPTDQLLVRKLLYNAVTRAIAKAIVVVQVASGGQRLALPPFAALD